MKRRMAALLMAAVVLSGCGLRNVETDTADTQPAVTETEPGTES